MFKLTRNLVKNLNNVRFASANRIKQHKIVNKHLTVAKKIDSVGQKLESKGFLRSYRPYSPIANVNEKILELCKSSDIPTDNSHKLNPDQKFQLLNECFKELDHSVPNSVLHEIKTIVPTSCSVRNCRSNHNAELRNGEIVRVFRFPKDTELQEKWLNILDFSKDFKPGNYSSVCEKHFEPDDVICSGKRYHLKKGALPLPSTGLTIPPIITDEVQITKDLEFLNFHSFCKDLASKIPRSWFIYEDNKQDEICLYKLSSLESYKNLKIAAKIVADENLNVTVYLDNDKSLDPETVGISQIHSWNEFSELLVKIESLEERLTSTDYLKRAINSLDDLKTDDLSPSLLQKFVEIKEKLSEILDENEKRDYQIMPAPDDSLIGEVKFLNEDEEDLFEEIYDMEAKFFTCNTCGSCFNSPYKLELHKAKHPLDEPLICDICNAHFFFKNKLRIHMSEKHIKRARKICQKCGVFVARSMKEHLLKHDSVNKIPCPRCGNKYFKDSLRRHIKRVHEKHPSYIRPPRKHQS